MPPHHLVPLWNYIWFNKNERNFIKLNVTFSETIKNMPLQKKKNTMKMKKNELSRTNLTGSSNMLHSLLMFFKDSFSLIVDSECIATDFAYASQFFVWCFDTNLSWGRA